MHITDWANTCDSVARGLFHACVRGCECICVVHDTPAPGRKEEAAGIPDTGMPQLREPSEMEPYRMTGRIF